MKCDGQRAAAEGDSAAAARVPWDARAQFPRISTPRLHGQRGLRLRERTLTLRPIQNSEARAWKTRSDWCRVGKGVDCLGEARERSRSWWQAALDAIIGLLASFFGRTRRAQMQRGITPRECANCVRWHVRRRRCEWGSQSQVGAGACAARPCVCILSRQATGGIVDGRL